jgi:choline monooxygenase
MPEFKEVKDFPSESDNLHNLPLFQWGPMLFTSFSKDLSREKFFAEMMARIGWMPLDQFKYRPDHSNDYEVDAHWALYCENYLEGFHIPYVHPGLNQEVDYNNYTTELFPYSNLQLGIAKEGKPCFDLPPSSPDYGKRIAGYYFWVFPNMMFNFYPWGLSVNIVTPVNKEKTKVSFIVYMWDESKRDQGAGADLYGVEMEDEEVVESVQRGIRSRFYDQGRYSVKQETGTHHFHQLIARFMNNPS